MGFDLQAHRGGLGLVVENTLAAFSAALEVGVTTLELDVQVTRDGHVVVAHDRDPMPHKSLDTGPAFEGDPAYPYVSNETFVCDLTLAQVRTIDVGSLRHPDFPGQRLAPGARMPLLAGVFDLVREAGADDVGLCIEPKVEAAEPRRTAPREAFVAGVVGEVRAAGMVDRVTIESFDWSTLRMIREAEPRLPLAALTNGAHFLQPGSGGRSPWLAGLDIDDFPGTLQQQYVAAAATLGFDAVSPVHGDPQNGSAADPDYLPFTTGELVDAAHEAGMLVVPWTVDDAATLRSLIGLGVDGVITNRPDLARGVMAECGLEQPRAYPRAPG